MGAPPGEDEEPRRRPREPRWCSLFPAPFWKGKSHYRKEERLCPPLRPFTAWTPATPERRQGGNLSCPLSSCPSSPPDAVVFPAIKVELLHDEHVARQIHPRSLTRIYGALCFYVLFCLQNAGMEGLGCLRENLKARSLLTGFTPASVRNF